MNVLEILCKHSTGSCLCVPGPVLGPTGKGAGGEDRRKTAKVWGIHATGQVQGSNFLYITFNMHSQSLLNMPRFK